MNRCLAIIPARGGSKGIPKKNIRYLNGKPLISYTVEAALNSEYISRIVVSTDDLEIADVARKYRTEVIGRPAELATDTASTVDVVLYSYSVLMERGETFDCVVLLQPTSPLRTTEDIDNAMRLFLSNDCDSVISVCESEHPPYWSCIVRNNFLKPVFGEQLFRMRRQDLPRTCTPNGAIYIIRPDFLHETRDFISQRTIPYVMSRDKSIDIDSEYDLIIAELLIKQSKQQ